MAYIDTNILEAAVMKSYKHNPHQDSIHRQLHNHEHRHFLCLIAGLPHADVVPRAEAEEAKKISTLYRQLNEGLETEFAAADENAKAEITQEVFAGILNILRAYEFDALVSKNNCWVTQVRNIWADILKFKQKFMEGNYEF